MAQFGEKINKKIDQKVDLVDLGDLDGLEGLGDLGLGDLDQLFFWGAGYPQVGYPDDQRRGCDKDFLSERSTEVLVLRNQNV